MTLIFIILICALSIFLSIIPNRSFAWSCDSQEPRGLYNRSQSVFIGKVIDLSYENVGHFNPKSRATFEVETSLKGNNAELMTLVTTVGPFFKKGEKYLVYAYKTTKEHYLYKYEKGEFATNTGCGGTKELSQASDDLIQIAKAKAESEHLKAIAVYLIPPLIVIVSVIVTWNVKRGRSAARSTYFKGGK